MSPMHDMSPLQSAAASLGNAIDALREQAATDTTIEDLVDHITAVDYNMVQMWRAINCTDPYTGGND